MPHLRVFYIKIWYLRCVQFVFGFDLTTSIALVRLVDMRSKVTTRDIEAHEQLSVDYGDSAPNCYPVCFLDCLWFFRRRTIYDNINQYHVTSKHTSSPCTNWLVDLHLTHWGWYFDPATLSEVRTEATKAYNEDLTHLQVWSEYG